MIKRLHSLNLFVILSILTAAFSPLFIQSTFAKANAQDAAPSMVTIAGTLQSELGCAGDWMPACDKSALVYDAEDDVWQGTFKVTPANDEDKKGPRYKAALNGGWDENYGQKASRGGADIPLLVTAETQVKFYYDHKTHWVTDNFNTTIVTAIGDFQAQLGCKSDNDAGCLRSWLEDPAAEGTFSLVTTALKAGTYQVQVALNEKNLVGEPQSFTVAKDGDEIYFGYDNVKKELVISTSGAPAGSLAKQKAHWVSQDTLLWNVIGSPKYSYSLFYSPDATLELSAAGIDNGTEIPLTYSPSGPGGDIFERNPYLLGYSAFKIDPADFDMIPAALKGQVAILARDEQGQVADVTGVQIPGVLDALYKYSGPLGVSWDGDDPTIRVWAPTAKMVTLDLFQDATSEGPEKHLMKYDASTGVWDVTGLPSWKGSYYLFEVQVYVPSTGKIETNLASDPYSLSLSLNSLRSQIVDLADPALMPQGWEAVQKPALAAPEDIVVYELHIRDFSIHDESVPEELRGTYAAFTVSGSNGMQHLKALAAAGLTHIHLLPAFDIASVDEDKSNWQTADETELAAYPPDSEQQAAAVNLIKGLDGFNWGYDPYHYTVPEGNYSTQPAGTARINEFREMVQSLNQNGLRVVMDVVYNHTSASGQDPRSVLDKIVPGYYYRLNADGNVEKSTCCENTASEHAMMEKLMVDSVITWARDYKVDGFRFDLMGHHMLSNMQAVRAALDGLTLEKDGVDGKSIYVYGECWDFGEVANNARGVNASQQNIGGTGIGVFNDRLRDGVRGGNPFDDPRQQGFSNGLFLQPNAAEQRPPDEQKAKLLEYSDWIRLGLAGNLRDYQITRANGDTVNGELIGYNGAHAGYTLDPQENIIYVSAHDNETIFDAIQLKAPAEASLAERIRMNNLALSIPMFSQGIPFFHAGDDILRSKSLDRNSYDSGDWFNKLDWTYAGDNWGVGLPIEGSDRWDMFSPLLADPALAPQKTDILGASAVFREDLQIRKSSPLFRLQSGEQVKGSVSFLNSGPDQVPGLIIMRITDTGNFDPTYNEIIVIFNANQGAITFSDASFADKAYTLHPIQQNSVDEVVREAAFAGGGFSVPGRTTAVFVLAGPPEMLVPSTPGLVVGAMAIMAFISGLLIFLTRKRK